MKTKTARKTQVFFCLPKVNQLMQYNNVQSHNSFKRTKQNSQQNNTRRKPFNQLPKQTIVSVALDRNQIESRYLLRQANGQLYHELLMSGQLRPGVFKQFLNVLSQEEIKCSNYKNQLQPKYHVPVSQYRINTMQFTHHFSPTDRRDMPEQYSSAHGINRFRLKLIEHYARANGPDPSLY